MDAFIELSEALSLIALFSFFTQSLGREPIVGVRWLLKRSFKLVAFSTSNQLVYCACVTLCALLTSADGDMEGGAAAGGIAIIEIVRNCHSAF